MSLWTSAQAVAATGGNIRGNWSADGVSIDSRSLQRGDLFIALQAARDGHDFVAQALDNGAAAAVVSRRPQGVAADAPLLLVPNVLAALTALGQAARARCNAQVVAVTGSVGKTSTKEMLRAVLRRQGRTHASVASYNNHWGVPLTLARMPANTEFAVFEIGMNHPGEIAPLSRMVRPHIAIVTTIAAAHLEAFDDIDAIAHEKAAVFQGLMPEGCAVIHADLPTSPILRAAAQNHAQAVLSFGSSAEAAYRLQDLQVGAATTRATFAHQGRMQSFDLAALGRHFAENALAVIATCQQLNLPHTTITAGLGDWLPVAGRGARQTVGLDVARPDATFEVIDEAYNANPTSLSAALAVLAEIAPAPAGGRRIAYLGDMKELGPQAAAMHAAIAQDPNVAAIASLHTVGPLMRHLHDALPVEKRGRWAATSAEMIRAIGADLRAGDVVLIKGSLSMAMGRVVDALANLRHARTSDMDGN